MVDDKTVTFMFKDGTVKKFSLCSSIKGLRDSTMSRPVKAVFNFCKDEELSRVEKESVYKTVMPSLDPMIGEVVYEC